MIGMIVATPVIATLKIIFEFILENTTLGEKFNDYQNNNKKTYEKKSTKEDIVKES